VTSGSGPVPDTAPGPAPGPSQAPRAVRRRTPWRALFFAVAVVGIIAGVAWALLGSRFLVVRSVAVSGTRLVSPSEVIAVADVPLGTPLIRVNTAQVARRVDGIRQVASAQVSKEWPDRLVIVVRERTPVLAVAMPKGGYDLLDKTGVIVLWSAWRPSGMPLYVTRLPGNALAGDTDLTSASTVLAQLPRWLSRSVVSVTAPAPQEVTLRLADGVTIVWGAPGRTIVKAAELAILLHQGARYLDVSAPGVAVTR
jgi:cell division protein FtsQ